MLCGGHLLLNNTILEASIFTRDIQTILDPDQTPQNSGV